MQIINQKPQWKFRLQKLSGLLLLFVYIYTFTAIPQAVIASVAACSSDHIVEITGHEVVLHHTSAHSCCHSPLTKALVLVSSSEPDGDHNIFTGPQCHSEAWEKTSAVDSSHASPPSQEISHALIVPEARNSHPTLHDNLLLGNIGFLGQWTTVKLVI